MFQVEILFEAGQVDVLLVEAEARGNSHVTSIAWRIIFVRELVINEEHKEGDGSGSAAEIFEVEYRIARPGTNLSSGLAAPRRIEGWKVPFLNGYIPFEILDNELPVYGPTGGETINKEPALSIYNLYEDSLLAPNDIISVKIERVANTSPFQVGNAGSLSANSLGADTYPGNIGIVGLRWTIDLT